MIRHNSLILFFLIFHVLMISCSEFNVKEGVTLKPFQNLEKIEDCLTRELEEIRKKYFMRIQSTFERSVSLESSVKPNGFQERYLASPSAEEFRKRNRQITDNFFKRQGEIHAKFSARLAYHREQLAKMSERIESSIDESSGSNVFIMDPLSLPIITENVSSDEELDGDFLFINDSDC
jgi:hypothetical protein